MYLNYSYLAWGLCWKSLNNCNQIILIKFWNCNYRLQSFKLPWKSHPLIVGLLKVYVRDKINEEDCNRLSAAEEWESSLEVTVSCKIVDQWPLVSVHCNHMSKLMNTCIRKTFTGQFSSNNCTLFMQLSSQPITWQQSKVQMKGFI